MRKSGSDIWDWLGLKDSFDYTKARSLGVFAGVIFVGLSVLFALTALISLFLLITALFSFDTTQPDPTGAAVRNIGLVVVAMFGAPFIFWRSIVAQRQVDVAEQGQITDRISKAVEGLGAVRNERRPGEPTTSDPLRTMSTESLEYIVPNLEVRIGAIFALERISQDSLRDHVQVMEILSAYIRNNGQRDLDQKYEAERKKDAPHLPEKYLALREDLRTALLVIGRRSPASIKHERSLDPPYSIDLQGANFSEVRIDNLNLQFAKLEHTIWSQASLRWADFSGAQITRSDFNHAELEFSAFRDSSLIHVSFEGGGVSESNFIGSYLDACIFKECGLHYAKFSDATISHCDFTQAKLMNANFGNASVSRAILEKAYLFGTDLSQSKGMDNKCLSGTLGIVSGDGMTGIPPHLSPPSNWLLPPASNNDADAFEIYEVAHKVMANADNN